MFDLQVEGVPEFTAGGVIVHNCVHGLTSLVKQSRGEGSFASAGAASAPMGAPPLRSPGF